MIWYSSKSLLIVLIFFGSKCPNTYRPTFVNTLDQNKLVFLAYIYIYIYIYMYIYIYILDRFLLASILPTRQQKLVLCIFAYLLLFFFSMASTENINICSLRKFNKTNWLQKFRSSEALMAVFEVLLFLH